MALWDLSRSRSHNLNKFDRGIYVADDDDDVLFLLDSKYLG
jgi:hypothetical protein